MPSGVDRYVGNMAAETNIGKLRKHVVEMQGELGFGESLQADADSKSLNESEKNDIMSDSQKTDASAKQKLIDNVKTHKWMSQVKAAEQTEILNILNQATVEELNYFNMNSALIKGNFYASTGGTYYDPNTQSISMDLLKVDNRTNAMGLSKALGTFFHETGHLIDDLAHKSSTGKRLIDELPELRSKLEYDALNYVNQLLSASDANHMPLKKISDITEYQIDIIEQDLHDNGHLKNGISDIYQGLTNHQISGKYGHKENPNYWANPKALEKEAFAHMSEAMMIKGEKLNIFKLYFPQTYQYFYDFIKRLGGVK